MGAGYSGYQQKTGIATDELPENLAKTDLDIDFNVSKSMEDIESQLVEGINKKINENQKSIEKLTTDLDRMKRHMTKKNIIKQESLPKFVNISNTSSLDRNNKTLITFEVQPKKLLYDDYKKNRETNNKLLFEYKPIKYPKNSSLNPNNHKLIEFENK